MRKVMRHYTSQPFQSNLHLLFLTKNKQSIITFIDSLCFVLCENITDAGMQAVTFSFLFFQQFLRDRELILQIQCFFPPRFCKCFVFVSVTTFSLQFCIFLVKFIQQQPKKLESAAYSRLALYTYPQYTSCKKFRQCRNK